ncbi:hypothetical protein E1267_23825 [Nonomuraea longispora]|uniref:Uncharacterized protein n=1 Tax=Nonomuraea longispora TaxID=1848320 RepID=A0A4R4N5Z1_9ACTN|nr:hypothetical protein [Nonomuraea longispora]TDC04155.1 hypothetical protein E1267_23825 [Nonomuraea longispora]
MPLVATGRLDARLFNVTHLAAMGYRGTPPVIATYRGATPRSMTGAEVVRAFPSLKGAALKATAAHAERGTVKPAEHPGDRG